MNCNTQFIKLPHYQRKIIGIDGVFILIQSIKNYNYVMTLFFKVKNFYCIKIIGIAYF